MRIFSETYREKDRYEIHQEKFDGLMGYSQTHQRQLKRQIID